MNKTSPITDAELDQLFSDFFKSQLKQPWPKAPTPAAAATPTATAEPSGLVAARAAETPRNAPAKTRDSSARARFTLAASVAFMLGTCWYLSNDFQPGSQPGAHPYSAPGTNFLPDSGANGGKGDVLDQINKNKTKNNNDNNNGVKIDPTNF